jgi:hypothetical protein
MTTLRGWVGRIDAFVFLHLHRRSRVKVAL